MKIGGVYILTRRTIKRMINAFAAALASLCVSASTPDQIHLFSRYSNTAQSLMSLKCSLKCDSARTVVPEPLYIEGKALYIKAKSDGVVPLLVAPAHGTRPVQAAVPSGNGRDARFSKAATKADLRAAVKTILRGEDISAAKSGPRITPAKQKQIEAAKAWRKSHAGCTLHNACIRSFVPAKGGYKSANAMYECMRRQV